jgi:hypothetical protein
MTRARLDVERRRSRDECQGTLELGHRSEWVRGAVDEERRRVEPGEVSGPGFPGSSRRMERVGKEKESPGHGGILRDEKRGLASSVGLAPEADVGDPCPRERGHRGAKSRAVTRGAAWRRRAVTPCLPER